MNLSEDEKRSFSNATCLFGMRQAVNALNLSELAALNVPCAKIQALHEANAPSALKNLSSDETGGLDPEICLAKGAKAMITRNLWLKQGLVNATTGIVEDVIWSPGAESRSEHPLAVLVSIKDYAGPTLW
ncbi:hypothetical protein BKA70DRAFT_550097 [Coprinopsis sp. MPI-PUGE-AT-0042]|nr:hypothetical protein BKA70DRAFT_550097 [Coprinopsis sp. MPI-PUGE-AT-0042]